MPQQANVLREAHAWSPPLGMFATDSLQLNELQRQRTQPDISIWALIVFSGCLYAA